ncbi:CO dehydrogenase/CO-methylating acetyl-CoA synthase complex subunit beta [Candidatus Bipolaricaulota bacterium]|nr:CO dehydrogenase/CO-methylating acetyl-CoA synthase complex subunit beta [Candidatus Bipolaricaulota bacterium]
MSKVVSSAAIRGAHKYFSRAEKAWKEVKEDKGGDEEVAFPNTGYYLPLIFSLTGEKVQTVEDMKKPLDRAGELLPEEPGDKLWTPYLGKALDAGISTLISQEILEALKLVKGNSPESPWLGFTDDSTLRTQGIKLVDGRMPGFAAIVGAAPTNEDAVRLAEQLREKNILVFLSSSTNGRSMAEQLAEEGVEMGWDTFLVPYGKSTSATVHALNFACRAALTFGGKEPGGLEEAKEILLYNKDTVHAFVLALGQDENVNENQLITDEKYATAAGALNFGFPTISDVALPEILPRGICDYEHVVSSVPMDKLVNKAVEVRDLEIEVTEVDIPVPFGAGFEGESVRKEDMFVEFGGKSSTAFELLRNRSMEDVEDEKIELIGPGLEEGAEEGESLPLGIVVEVAGREFKEDFETIVERRFHEFISWAGGIFHMGQRAIPWIRISKDSYEKGFRLEDFGTILISKIKEEFSSVIDKVQVTLITDKEEIQEPLERAKEIYHQRDERILGMKDSDVDTFYSCTLCQTYAPDHVCIVTPERLGLCGAYTWLDCKAGHEMDPQGPNQPVEKGESVDEVYGQWKGVNEYLARETDGNLKKFSAYSMIKDPMTSCGCFECIAAVLPQANGVMIASREYPEMTPIGMSFSTMAGQVGGGVQTPGFIGIGKMYITSDKFISADVPDGHKGIERVVWMPSTLKREIEGRLKERLDEIGKPELFDKIATEEDAVEASEVVEYLEEVNHPALEMEAMM